jgi:hypothetical protein
MRAMTSHLMSGTITGRARQFLFAGVVFAALLGAACSSSNSTTDAGASCGTVAPCTATQVCVKGQNIGGAVMCPGDGGTCASGYTLNTSSGCCDPTPTWSCQAKPSGCSAGVTCDCASTLCQAPQTCSAANDIEVDCTALVP